MAAIGIYGLMAYSVEQQDPGFRAFGVRLKTYPLRDALIAFFYPALFRSFASF